MAKMPEFVCKKNTYTGKEVLVDVAFACGDVLDPKILPYYSIGGFTTKSLTSDMDTLDATTDITVGDFRDMTGSYKSLSFSGDGVAARKDGSMSNVNALSDAYYTRSQVNVWLRLTYPGITFWFYSIVTSFNLDGGNDELVTFSTEFVATGSSHGVIIERTENSDVEISVELTSTTVDLTAIGEKEAIDFSILPANADQRAVFKSSDEDIATVDYDGVVTAVGEGTCEIEVISIADMSKTKTVDVSVVVL